MRKTVDKITIALRGSWFWKSFGLVAVTIAVSHFAVANLWPTVWLLDILRYKPSITETVSLDFWGRYPRILLLYVTPLVMLFLINLLLIWKWIKWEKREENFSLPAIWTTYGIGMTIVPVTYIIIKVLAGLSMLDFRLWAEIGKINFFSTEFALILGLPAFIFTVYGTMKSSIAEVKAQKLISDLIGDQLLTSGGNINFVQCFKEALYKPMVEEVRGKKNVRVSLLLSNPIFGLYSWVKKTEREDFWGAFIKSQAIRELILYSPDAHHNFLVRWLLREALDKGKRGNDDGHVKIGALPGIIAKQMKLLERQAKKTTGSLKLWLTEDCGYRIARFDYEISKFIGWPEKRANVFVMLTHPSSLKRGPNDFRTTLLPIIKNLHAYVSGDENSAFDQFKRCPYSTLTRDKAILKSERIITKDKKVNEFTNLTMDMLYLRTSNRMYQMAYLKDVCVLLHQEFVKPGNPSSAELADSVKQMIKVVVEYFKTLNEKYAQGGKRDKSFSDNQMERLKTDDSLLPILQAVSGCSVCLKYLLYAFLNFEEEKQERHFRFVEAYKHYLKNYLNITLSKTVTIQELGKVTQCDNYVAILFYLLSSGFRNSKYAENRQELVPEGNVTSSQEI